MIALIALVSATLSAHPLPADALRHAEPPAAIELGAHDLLGSERDGVVVVDGEDLTIAGIGAPDDQAPVRAAGIADSKIVPLDAPRSIERVEVDAETPADASLTVWVRGRTGRGWSEWRESDAVDELDDCCSTVQARVELRAAPGGDAPRVRSVRVVLGSRLVRSAQVAPPAPPTATVWATRIGMVGHTTANGHVITDRDRFVALPSKRALSALGSADYSVQITYRGRSVIAPVWDVGPWNQNDDYWNEPRERFADLPRWTSEAEAAFFAGYNGGRDGSGRFVVLPNSIDLADGSYWDDLGMTRNDWVDVTFLWLNAPSPPRRSTPVVTPKLIPGTTGSAAATPSTRAVGYTPPSTALTAFLPLVMCDPDNWTTSWTIQNSSSVAVSGSVEVYSSAGALSARVPFALPGWGSATTSTADVGLAPGFAGSAIVNASGPVATVVSEERSGGGRLVYAAATTPAPTLYAPMIFKGRGGWDSGIQVQNLGNSAAAVRVTYVSTGGGAWDESASIPASGARAFYQPANASLPSGLVGAAVVQSMSGQPLAAVVNATNGNGAGLAYALESGAADTLYAPVVYKRYNGWDSGIQLFNLNPSPTIATILYQQSAGPPITDAVTVPGSGATSVYQPSEPQLPDGFVGSARIVGGPGARLVGIASEVRSAATAAMGYVLGQPQSTLVAAPLVTKSINGWNTGIQVQNPTQSPAPVTADFYDESGALMSELQDVVDAGRTRTFYTPALADLPKEFRGSAVIQSTSGVPLAVVVNQTSE
ncbi:MAG TPA: hypothetical protein VFC51_07505 [Chloroflexota bacterium]|nr:hypothetical protein [Chloroflexota bacterium]